MVQRIRFGVDTRIYDTVGLGLVTAMTLGAGPPGWVALGVLYLALALLLSRASNRYPRGSPWLSMRR